MEKKWILVVFNSKGHNIRVLNEESVNPDIIKNYYRKLTDELPLQNQKKELITINVSNVIDWILSLDISLSEKELEYTAEKLLRHDEIALAVQHHIENGSYDKSEYIEGYTAQKLSNEVKDKLSVIGVYNYLVYLKESPKEALENLKKGLPVR